jgi:hypothetical protein
MCGNSYDTKIGCLDQPLCSQTVVNNLIVMDRTIDLHNDPLFCAVEISDEPSNNLLTSKFEAQASPISQ